MIIIPKIENFEADVTVAFGCTTEQKEQLKKEAREKDISVSKLLRRKLFPR